MSKERLKYGPSKYAALNLMIAKWLRGFAIPSRPYYYVTLGGTELFDIANIAWIDRRLVSAVWSFEMRSERYKRAKENEKNCQAKDISVQVIAGDIFEYQRRADENHIYFIDLEGICSADHYRPLFQDWFERDIIRPGDLLLITSYLGRKPGWQKVLTPFDSEFRILRVTSLQDKKNTYMLAHPLFILYQALLKAGLDDELSLRCLGCIKYKDTSPMGLYGIVCEEGHTKLNTSVKNVPFFDMMKRDWADIVL